jgi:hypothetical protein
MGRIYLNYLVFSNDEKSTADILNQEILEVLRKHDLKLLKVAAGFEEAKA